MKIGKKVITKYVFIFGVHTLRICTLNLKPSYMRKNEYEIQNLTLGKDTVACALAKTFVAIVP